MIANYLIDRHIRDALTPPPKQPAAFADPPMPSWDGSCHCINIVGHAPPSSTASSSVISSSSSAVAPVPWISVSKIEQLWPSSSSSCALPSVILKLVAEYINGSYPSSPYGTWQLMPEHQRTTIKSVLSTAVDKPLPVTGMPMIMSLLPATTTPAMIQSFIMPLNETQILAALLHQSPTHVPPSDE
jgi:hypothetical protein